MNFKMQSGRSMVEMLGTLAIIGVLSIGGIAGYKYGIDKYHANETINELTTRAMGLMQQVSRGEIVELNMEMGDKTKLGYGVDAWIDEADPRYFYIALINIPSSICRQILKQKWTLPTNIYGIEEANSNLGLDEKDACGEEDITNQIDFEFYRDFAISGDGEGEVIMTMPFGKCPADNPLATYTGACYHCDDPWSVYVGNGSCQSVCPNRRLSEEGNCVLACGEGVNAGKPLMDIWGNCHACSDNVDVHVGAGACESVCGDLRYKEVASCKLKK